MYVIGLTGGIASGKSTASETLRALGAHIIDADAISRRLTSPGGAAEEAILERFGTIDRRQLGAIVFRDRRARQALNSIVHPMVRAEMEREIDASAAPVVVLDVPLLFETGMEDMADEVWVVHIPWEEQVRRVMERDGLIESDAIARINSQMSTEDKLARADVAIDNSGTVGQTRIFIEDLWQETLARQGIEPSQYLVLPQIRRHRIASRRMQQHRLEAEVSNPALSHTRPFQPPKEAWEDTSTLLETPEERSFFARQSPVFWIAAAVLLIALLTVTGSVGITMIREYQAEQAEARRLQQIAEERARYKLEYRDLIDRYSAEQSIDPTLVAAVIYNESRFDPNAVSRVGARGLMQIMEDTGSWIAGKFDEQGSYSFDQLFTPETNIRYGTWYLGFLSRTFDGDMVKMVAGYHAGQNAVLRWLSDPEYSSDGVTLDVIPYPDTEQYVQRVVNTYEIYWKHYYGPNVEQLPEEYLI